MSERKVGERVVEQEQVRTVEDIVPRRNMTIEETLEGRKVLTHVRSLLIS